MNEDIRALFENQEFDLRCPVHALNYDDNAYVIAGSYLLSLNKEERDKYLKIPDEVRDESILFFDDRHLFEIGGMLLGILDSTIKIIDWQVDMSRRCSDVANIIKNAKYNTYANVKRITKSTIKTELYYSDLEEKKQTEFRNVLFDILDKIWFISYADIDKLIRLAVDEYNKENSDAQETESADTTD